MKMSEIKVEEIKDFPMIQEMFHDHFGAHWPDILGDFKAINLGYIQSIGDPEVTKEQEDQAQQAIIFYLMYYAYGVGNTVDPSSNFNVNFDNAEKINKAKKEEQKLDSADDKLLNKSLPN